MSTYQPERATEQPERSAPRALHPNGTIAPDWGGVHSPPQVANVALSRRVFTLAWPVIGENFLETLLGIVDTWLVASLGVMAIAGVGSAIQFMFFVIAALSAVSVGSSVLVAQAVGAQALARASQFAKQSLVWSVILSIPLIIIGLVAAEALVGIFGMEPAATLIGAQYLRVTMGTVAVLTLLFLGGGVLRGAGDSRTPMLVTALANVINVFLAYGLIFGRWGLPEMGAVGSAWATFAARTVALILLLIVMWRGVNGVSIRGRANWWPQWAVVRQVLKIGVPAAVEQLLISAAFLVFTIVVAGLGTVALAAQRIAINAMSLSFLPGSGFGVAATTLVGQSIGTQQPEEGRVVARIATLWGLSWMSVLGLVFFLFADPIMRAFTDDPTVIATGAAGLRIIAFTQPFWAIAFVQTGALRGTGDTQYPLWVNTLAMWAAVGLSALFVRFFDNSMAAAWASFLLTAPCAAWLLWRRFGRAIAAAKPALS